MNTVIERIKSKYPVYADVPDEELTKRVAEKYPAYLERKDFKDDFVRASGFEPSLVPEPPAQNSDELAARNFYSEWQATGAIPTRGHESFWQNLNAPTFEIAEKMTAQEMQAHLTPRDPETTPGTAAKVMAGVQGGVANIINSFTSPLGIATLGIGALPKAIQATVAAGFATHMASTVPEQAKIISEALERGDTQAAAQAITEGGANVVMAGLAGRHAFKSGKEVLTERAAEVGPATEAVVKNKEALETPPERVVPTETAPVELEKPAEVAQPASAEPPSATPTTPVDIAPVERVMELQAPPKAELIGMGAATPAEYVQTPQTPTGIKNRTVDLERAKRDLPPAMDAGRQSFGEAWDRAMARMDKDPEYQRRLIAELGDKPRAVTDIEDAALLHRQVDLQNEYGKATRAMAQAFDDGRMEDVAHEQLRVSDLSDQLHELYTINQAVGTETGRGLAARKMMAYEDFSLAKMEVERRAAKGGAQLTPEERAEVVTLQKKIEEAQKRYDDYVAKTQTQITALEVKAAMAATTKKAQETISPKIKAIAERIVNNLEREADAAWKRIQERGVMFGSGPLHELPNIKDFAIIGASKAVKAGVDFAQWSVSMTRQFGEGIKPHLERIWDESQKMLNSLEEMKPLAQEAPKRRKQDPTAAKLHFEQAKAKKEWQEKLIEEKRKNLPAFQKAMGMTGEVLNTTRAVMTSADLSAVLRQGGFITLAHPIRAAQSFPAMLRAFRSEAKAHAVNLEIASRPNYPLYRQAKLYLSEHGHSLSKMEEAYMSRWAEKIPLVAGSQRAYTTFLNKLRADSFDAMEKTLSRNGKATPEEAAAIANFINVATGRGALGKAENAAVGLNTAFFAPRYVASRFQLLAGTPMWKGTARTRTAIAKEYARYLMGLGVIYGLGQLAGAEIETDSRSSDFGKMRFGNTRIDPLSGLQQVAVLESRLASGETKKLSGKVVPIRGEKVPYGSGDASDVLKQFIRTKLSPVVGAGVDIVSGENVVGEPVTPGSVVQNLTVPLAFRDIYKAMIEQGIPEGTAMGLLSILGMGVQTYEPK